jgi:hypothetical protein
MHKNTSRNTLDLDNLGVNRTIILVVQRNSERTYHQAAATFSVVTDSVPGSSLAAAAAYCGDEFHVKCDPILTL